MADAFEENCNNRLADGSKFYFTETIAVAASKSCAPRMNATPPNAETCIRRLLTLVLVDSSRVYHLKLVRLYTFNVKLGKVEKRKEQIKSNQEI